MKLAINVSSVALEVVEVLHRNQIPIAMTQSVFNEAMHLVNAYTVPYSPSLQEPIEEVEQKASDTLPQGLVPACVPAIEYLKKNCTPHDSLVITDEQFRLVNGTVDYGPVEHNPEEE